MESFKALLVEQPEAKQFTRSIVCRTLADLPQGDLVVRVQYSSLNFKDALSATGNPGSDQELSAYAGDRRCGNRDLL